jgi:hypothetical protein
MSYRQLAKIEPTTLSVHWILAINVKTHFAKDLFDRQIPARFIWQTLGTQENRSLDCGNAFSVAPVGSGSPDI